METVTFYSYKGGVGRTLALAYIARYLADNNFSICILDIDLEAPGIVYKDILFDEAEAPGLSRPGVLDYIRICLDDELNPPETIDDYFYSYPVTDHGGYIRIMSAGQGFEKLKYWQDLAKTDWNDLFFGKDKRGIHFFNRLKNLIKKQINPDYLFIDSRSGITVLSKVCTMALADIAVILAANNDENRRGTKLMYQQISSSPYNYNEEKIKVICTLTRVPALEVGDSPQMEKEAINNLITAIENQDLTEDDISVIHSERIIEFNEKLIGNKDIKIHGDYYGLISRIVHPAVLEAKQKAIAYNPQQGYLQYDIIDEVSESLKRLYNHLTFEEFHEKTEEKVKNADVSYDNLYALALCKRHEKKYTEAVAYMSRAVSLKLGKKDKLDAYYYLGIMFLYDFRNYEAVNYLKIADELNPDFKKALQFHLAIGLYLRKEYDEALKCLNKYLSRDELDSRAIFVKALILVRKAELQDNLNTKIANQILDIVNQAIELNEKEAHFYSFKGHIYTKISDFKAAIASCSKALELSEEALYYMVRGAAYRGIDKEKALLDLDKAIEMEADYGSAYIDRGNIYSDIGFYKKALNDYNKAIELRETLDNSDLARAYNNRGLMYESTKNNDEAFASYLKAVEINPDYFSAYINLGKLYEITGDDEEALHRYEEIIKRNPDYSLVYKVRSRLYDRLGFIPEAKNDMIMYRHLKSKFN
ncbi:MAG: tetratricopeptide repeat protein [Lachnospiraceae bacterium]|nr:tetratricopeptide repeat protein [Lachnospiraceae bacterium]